MITVVNLHTIPKGWENDPQYVYIGRKGKGQEGTFGNPFALAKGDARGSSLEKFEAYARHRMSIDPKYKAAVKGLQDKTLVCFCAPLSCHGDILAKLCEELNSK